MTSPLFALLRRLEAAKIHFTLARHTDETVDVVATLVGRRLEISVFEDGRVQFSEFLGDESVREAEALDAILEEEARKDACGPPI